MGEEDRPRHPVTETTPEHVAGWSFSLLPFPFSARARVCQVRVSAAGLAVTDPDPEPERRQHNLPSWQDRRQRGVLDR